MLKIEPSSSSYTTLLCNLFAYYDSWQGNIPKDRVVH